MGRKPGMKRAWRFTVNNYTDDDLHHLDDSDEKQVRYFICGGEVGEEGTPHLQGYVYFHNPKDFHQAKAFIGERANIEPTNGSPEQNRAYCSKDGKFIEYGDMPKQGSRSDIATARQRLINGDNIFDVVTETSSYQAARHVELIYRYQTMRQPPLQQRQIQWYATKWTTGKLTQLAQTYKDYYVAQTNTWDAYTGQQTVIMKIEEDPQKLLLRLLSTIPCQLNTRWGIRYLQPTTKQIVIISTKMPMMFYDDSDSVELHCLVGELILDLDPSPRAS